MNKNLLKAYIVRYDETQLNLASAMGLSLSRLNAKINEKDGAEFTQNEMNFIRKRYKLDNSVFTQIFFSEIVS